VSKLYPSRGQEPGWEGDRRGVGGGWEGGRKGVGGGWEHYIVLQVLEGLGVDSCHVAHFLIGR
jgi:hypothetical protein